MDETVSGKELNGEATGVRHGVSCNGAQLSLLLFPAIDLDHRAMVVEVEVVVEMEVVVLVNGIGATGRRVVEGSWRWS